MTGQLATIVGPIISAANIADHRFFFDHLGGTASATSHIDESQCDQMFAQKGLLLDTELVQWHPTDFGVRLWAFDEPSISTIRLPGRGTDLDALKVIDFYASDFDRALALLAQNEIYPRHDIAEYSLPEGAFREAHFCRPDNVICAVISGPNEFFKDFATLTGEVFSEPQSISAPVSNAHAVLEFYAAVFGFDSLYSYEIDNASFDALVGSDKRLKLKAVNVGQALSAPYLGVIDYGSIAVTERLLGARSQIPRRGLIGIEMTTEHLAEIVDKATREDAVVSACLEPVDYAPYGPVISALIRGPHGVLHHVLQRC